MGRQSIEGFSYQGALEDFDTLTKLAQKRFVTVLPLGPNRSGLDVITNGLFVEGPADRVVEAGSTDSLVVLTGHDAYVGQVVRLKTTANTIRQKEVAIKEIVDANSFLLEGRLDADLTPGDTFDLLGGISQTFTSSGAPIQGPIQFTLDGVDVSVNEDTVTPANNRPLPVKLTDITGDINITAGDLNVQLSHTGASADSTQIGDGTEILQISTAGEALTQPGGNVAANAADAGNPVKVGGVYNAVLPTYDDGDRANLHTDVNGRLLVSDITISGTPGTFAEDAAHTDADVGYHMLTVRQDTLAASTSADGDYGSLKANNLGEAYVTDTSNLAQNTAINGKLVVFDADTGAGTENVLGSNLRISSGGGSIEAKGQQTMAQSIPVAIASDQSTLPISAASLPLPTGAATETTLAALAAEDFATETTLLLGARELTLAAMSAKLPAALGKQTAAASLSITLSSDEQLPTQAGRTAVGFARLDYSVTNVTTGAYEQIIASVPATANKMEIFDSSGQTLKIAFGAAAAEVDQFLVFPGGNGPIDINVPAATRISIQAVSALADAGEISINFYS